MMTPLRLQQEAIYAGDGYWKWSIWLEGPAAVLDEVEYVEYILHRTFSNPIRRISDRASKFKISDGAWGAFTIYAKVVSKDGSRRSLEQGLQLEHSGKEVPDTEHPGVKERLHPR